MNFKFILTAVLLALSAFAQTTATGSTVMMSDAPPKDFYSRYFYTSAGDIYTCIASSIQAKEYAMTITSTVAGATTSLVFSAGHGFHADATPKVTVSGGTGAWSAVNSVWKATYVSATTVTIPIDSSGFGAVAGTIAVKSAAPRLTNPVWAVSRYRPTGADPSSVLWASDGWSAICSNYTTLSYQ